MKRIKLLIQIVSLFIFAYAFPKLIPMVVDLFLLNPPIGFAFLACALVVFPVLAVSSVRKNKKRLMYKPPPFVALPHQPMRDLQWETFINALDPQKPAQTLAHCRAALKKSYPKARLFSAALLDQPNVMTSFLSDPELSDRAEVLSAFIKHAKTNGLPFAARFTWIKKITEASTPAAFATLLDELVWLLARADLIPIIQKALTSTFPVLLATAIVAAGRFDMQAEAREWAKYLHRYNAAVDEAIARAFGLLSCNDYKNRLLELLKHPTPEVQIAAAESLGKKGNLPDIPALRALISDDSDKTSLKSAVQAAIDLITKRFGVPGQQGDLALVEFNNDAGALSLPEDQKPARDQ